MAIRLTEAHINNLVFKILNGETPKKKKATLSEKIDNLIDFHVKYHKGLYNVYGNNSELEKNKKHYLNNLFPGNHKIIKECRLRFKNNIINESKGSSYIDEFFDFIKENYIKEIRKKPLSEQQTNQAKQAQQQKMVAARQAAIPLAKSLMKAFDGAGTDEALAVQTIKKIKSKEEIYQLNKILQAYKRPNLKAYINGDMSDFDSKEYRTIWAHLGKFGLTGANFNNFLAGVGKVVDVIGAGWDWLKKNGLTKFMTTIREFLDSGWGQSAQLFLDSFGLGAVANVIVWGLMAVWDLLNNNWGYFLLSALSVLTAGAIAPLIGKYAKNFKGITGGLTKALEYMKNTPIGKGIANWIPKISAGIASIGKWIGEGVNWLIGKFGKFLPANWVSSIKNATSKAVGWVKSAADSILNFAGKETGETFITDTIKAKFNNFPGIQSLLSNPKWTKTLTGIDKAGAKLIDEYIIKYGREYSWASIEGGICKNMGTSACSAVKTVGLSYQLKREAGEALHKSKESVSDVKKAASQINKVDKAKDLYTASGNVKTALEKGKEAEEIGAELTGAEGEEA